MFRRQQRKKQRGQMTRLGKILEGTTTTTQVKMQMNQRDPVRQRPPQVQGEALSILC